MKAIAVFSSCLILIGTGQLRAQWVETNGPYGGWINALGTGNGSLFIGTLYNGGVFRSTDHGMSWKAVNKGLADTSHGAELREIGKFAFSESKVFAATSTGVFASADNGERWGICNNGIPVTQIRAISAAGTNVLADDLDYNLYFSKDEGETWVLVDSSAVPRLSYPICSLLVLDTNLFVGTEHGVFLSSDWGSSWIHSGSGLPDTAVGSLAICGTRVFAGTDSGLFFSDNWINWKSTSLPHSSILSISVDDSNVLVGAISGLFLSTNCGASWKDVCSQNNCHNIISSFPVAVESGYLFVGSDDPKFGLGISRSTDMGGTWTYTDSGFAGTLVSSISASGKNLFAVSWLSTYSLLRSTDDGESWVSGGISGVVGGIDPIAVSGDTVFVAGGGEYSQDNGRSWNPTGAGCSMVSVAAAGSEVLLGAYQGLCFSTDGARHWTEPLSVPNQSVSFSAVGIFDNDLFAGGSGAMYMSTNSGESWLLSGNTWNNLVVSSFAKAGSHLFVGTNKGIFVSADTGRSWTAADTGLTNLNITSLASFKCNVFASTWGGVFLSTDYGNNWVSVDTGLTNLSIYSIAISDGYIFASTIGSGVWRRPLSEMVEAVDVRTNPFAELFHLSQNYPNPFNPTTTITYFLPGKTHVTLRVYDVLGREVRSLVNEEQSAGTHVLTFNASDLPSGVYFCRLQIGSYRDTKKLLLLK